MMSWRHGMTSFDIFGQEYWQGGHNAGKPAKLGHFHSVYGLDL